MLNYELIERNKNNIINAGIVVLALIIAFNLHRSTNDQISNLLQQQTNELEKNKVAEDIATLEKKAESYKKVFVKRDLAAIMDVISNIARTSSVKINSVKPFSEEPMGTYFNSSYLITLNAKSYHALGDFVSKIENLKDIYLISEVSIVSALPMEAAVTSTTGAELSVTIKINIISYL